MPWDRWQCLRCDTFRQADRRSRYNIRFFFVLKKKQNFFFYVYFFRTNLRLVCKQNQGVIDGNAIELNSSGCARMYVENKAKILIEKKSIYIYIRLKNLELRTKREGNFKFFVNIDKINSDDPVNDFFFVLLLIS